MDELFIEFTGYLAAALALATFGVAAVLVHLAFFASWCRRSNEVRYAPFITYWLFRRAVPIALLLSLGLLLLAVIPASFLAWYRTRTVHEIPTQSLMLRVYDDLPVSGEKGVLVSQLSYSTTNAAEIAELLAAIRLSPTYPNHGCLCAGGRKFELVKLTRKGEELPITETFSIPHGRNIRFDQDWYGDWHLWKGAQAEVAAWERKYVPVRDVATHDVANSPAPEVDDTDSSTNQFDPTTGLPIHPTTGE